MNLWFHFISTQNYVRWGCPSVQYFSNISAARYLIICRRGRGTANRRKEATTKMARSLWWKKWQKKVKEPGEIKERERTWWNKRKGKNLVKYGAKSLALFFPPTLSSYCSYSPQLLLSNSFFLSQGHGPDSSNSFMCTKEWRLLQPLDFGVCTMPVINWG